MILRDDKKRRSASSKKFLLWTFLGLLPLLILIYLFWQGNQPDPGGASYYCSAETLSPDSSDNKVFFLSGDLHFDNGQTQSNGEAFSGKYSSLTHAGEPFGMGIEIEDVKAGEHWEVEVWRKSSGNAGNLVASGDWGLYLRASGPKRSQNDWELLQLSFNIPINLDKGKLKIYCWNPDNEQAFFDDLKIIRKPGKINFDLPEYTDQEIPVINLIIGDKGTYRLENKRQAALEKGLLIAGDNDWVKAKVVSGKEELKAQIRLKGDWTDHLRGKKWSYRVKLASGQAWKGMTEFSLQNPETRHYLSEWVYHQLLRHEDILTTRYDFVHLKVNNVSKGIYAYEEHFVKQLPESQKRREGPILKFDENGFWESMERQFVNNTAIGKAFSKASAGVSAFKMGRTLKDPNLNGQFQEALKLMQEYRNREKSVWEIFDAEKLARFYAIVDLAEAYHGFIWHNHRFYYNPVIARLEPIGFDGYSENGPEKWINRPFVGYGRSNPRVREDFFDAIVDRFFKDEAFLTAYVQNLLRLCSESYMQERLREWMPEIKKREALIQKEVLGYHYRPEFLLDNAKRIRAALLPLPNASIKAYSEGQKDGSYRYRLVNYHSLPLKALGVGKSPKRFTAFEEAQLLPAYTEGLPPDQFLLKSPQEGKKVIFSLPGLDSLFAVEVLPYPYPAGVTPEQELFQDLEIQSNELYAVEDKIVRIRPGKHTVEQNLLIPRGYTLQIRPGTELDLVKGAALISKSTVNFLGTEEEPVIIRSSDNSGSVTILQAPGQSVLGYCHFLGLTNLDYKNWTLTGAVTFYESQVEIQYCKFSHNISEDALNLVRSSFILSNSEISDTQFDGLDLDFCSGKILHCDFIETGNDGIDLSGCDVSIEAATVIQPGDKGISVGEESVARIHWAKIHGAKIGLAAKDLSQVEVSHIEFKNVEQAFAVYQKKPEYGPADIVVEKFSQENVEQLYTLQEGSTLTLGDRKIIGKR